MNKSLCIRYLRPHLRDQQDFEVEDVGNGQEVQWFANEPEPTENELEAVWLDAVKKAKREELINSADVAYKREIPSFAGVIVAAKWAKNVPLNAYEQSVYNKITTGYDRLNNLLIDVNTAKTVEAVQAIRW